MGGGTFYRIDSSRVSLREYWWGSRSPAILIAALLKLFRVRLPSATDDPAVESLAPFEVPCQEVPEAARARFAPLLRQLEQLGFSGPVWHAIQDDVHHVQTHLATAAHRGGRAWARVHRRLWHLHAVPREVLFVEIVSERIEGGFVWSLSSKPDLAAPPSCTVVRLTGALPAALWNAHRAALGSVPVLTIESPEDLRAAVERHHAAVRDFHLARGVFRAVSDTELAQARTHEADREAAAATGSQHPEVLAEVQRLQRGRSSWTSALLVLLVSIAMYVGLGGPSGLSMPTLLALLPILFFHEAGHWLAMRVFGYRNLRMFFIPFFGAAVSGRHYNVPGWKKAVVSLMGPLPGIVLGAVLGAAGMGFEQPLLLRAALLTLVLNGFNLLPVLPLDGGFVLQAILFSRHLVLEVVFRGAAVVALLALAFFTRDRVLGALGVVMLLALPTSYRLARVTRDLRLSGLQPVSTDDQTIPAEQAEAIVSRIAQAFPGRLPTKQAARHTLAVFETLNARPPGLLGSLGLAAAHAAGLVAAVAFTAVFFVAQQTSLSSFVRSVAELPRRTLDPAAVEVEREAERAPTAGLPSEPPAPPHETVIANFASGTRARQTFLELQRQRNPVRSGVELFGQSVLVSLPAGDGQARQQWLALLQGRASAAFVATPQTSALLQLSCLARTADEATTLERDLVGYLVTPAMDLVPPWIVPDTRSAEEHARHARARETYRRLVGLSDTAFRDPRLAELLKQMLEAQRRRDKAGVERLRTEQARLAIELRAAELARIREAPDVDQAVLARFGELSPRLEPPDDVARLRRELGPLLGQLEIVNGAPTPRAAAVTATGGPVTRDGLLLRLSFVRFSDPFEGPPALARWLAASGCTEFRYDFGPGYEIGGDESGTPRDEPLTP